MGNLSRGNAKATHHHNPSPYEAFLGQLDATFPAFRAYHSTFSRRPPSLRVNTLRTQPTIFLEQAARAGVKLQRVPWSHEAFVVTDSKQSAVESLPAYEQGEIYLQSLASQVPPLVLDPKPGMRVLDLCAAPGGKTAQIAALMRGEGELWALEKEKIRFERLRFNLQRQRVLEQERLKVTTLNADALTAELPERYFDAILIDAPCSGEARFVRNDSRTWQHWSHQLIKELSVLQKELLKRTQSLLAEGGVLVYSTCTINPEENERVVAYARSLGFKAEQGLTGAFSKVVPEHLRAQVTVAGQLHDAGARLKPTAQVECFFMVKLRAN